MRARLWSTPILAGIVFLAGAMLAHAVRNPALEDAIEKPAAPEAVAASLASGVAWIWPQSNGPQAARPDTVTPYHEAAVLLESLVLRGRGVERGGRQHPLVLPAGVHLIPVVHVEAASDAPAELSVVQREAIIAAVRRHAAAAVAGAGVLQLDYEAPARQRDTFRALVAEVRAALPADVRLSITALAHWCAQGDWLDRLPVDEVVPMLYRLGPHANAWRNRFVRNSTLARRCRGPALGFATNDPPPSTLIARTARPYWFDESGWSNPSLPLPYLLQ